MPQIHVTGASGALATSVLQRLADRPDVVKSSRTGGSGARFADFDDPSSLAPAFDGAETMLLVSAGQGEDDVVIARHAAAIRAAEEVGVRHIVYTSLTGAAEHVALATAHRWTEERLQRGSAAWTVLRNGLYAELAAPFAQAAATSGHFTAPMGAGRWAAVARDDLADVAATVLRAPGTHAGQTYELVGQDALSGDDIAAAVARGAGRPVAYAPVTLAVLRDQLVSGGVPGWQLPMIVSAYANIQAGFLAGTGSDLARLLRRPPTGTAQVITACLQVS